MPIELHYVTIVVSLALLLTVLWHFHRHLRAGHRIWGLRANLGASSVQAGVALILLFYVFSFAADIDDVIGATDHAELSWFHIVHAAQHWLITPIALLMIVWGLNRERGIADALAREADSARARLAEDTHIRELLDLVPLPIVLVKDADKSLQFANAATHELLAGPPGSATIETLTAITEAIFDGSPDKPLHQGSHVDLENSKGDRIPALAWRTPIEFAGEMMWMMSILDTTHQAQAQRALRDSESRYRSIFEFSPLPMYLQDGKAIIAANPEAARVYGYDSPEAMKGISVIDLIHPDDRPQYRERLRDMLSNPRRLPFVEDRRVRRDGSTVIVEQSGVPFESGGELSILAISRDLTEYRKTEDALRQAQKMESVGQLTGGLAHDFNNLLAVILGNLELIRATTNSETGHGHHLEAIELAANRGADLTKRLLAFARRQPLTPQPVDLNELIESNGELFRRTLGETISLTINPSDVSHTVFVDRPQLETALLNLALNARDAMSHGGELTISVDDAEFKPSNQTASGDAQVTDYAVLTVADTGLGMSSETADKVFEPFFTTKPTGEGTGLGLSMVFGFVKQSGGHVTVDSAPNEGAVFRLYLPRYEADGSGTHLATRCVEIVSSGRGRSVLVVEDDSELRPTIAAMLRQLEFDVYEASNGDEALAQYRSSQDISLLLTDVILPGTLNGPALAEAVREVRPLDVIYMSGYPADAAAAVDDDRDALFLPKPFGLDDLADAIARLEGEDEATSPIDQSRC
jgi:PAS domain S-box-containing protein